MQDPSARPLPPAPGRGRRRACLFVVLLLAAALRLWGLGFGLPQTACRPDESVIVELATQFWTEDLNPHFFRYPTLHIYLTSLAFGADYVLGRALATYGSLDAFRARLFAERAHFHLLARALSVLFGTVTVLALYRLAAAALGRGTGLAAAFFLSLTYLHARDAHFGTTDMLLGLLLTLSAFFVWRCHARGRPADYVYAGVFAGLAASTKYVGVLMAMPLLIAHVTRARPSRARTWGAGELRKLAAFGACLGLAFLAGTPYALPEWRQVLHDVMSEWDYARGGYGETFGRGWSFHPAFSLWYGLGWPQLVAAAIGMALLVARARRRAAVLLGFPLAYGLLIARDRTVFVRYVLPLVPFLCLAAAFALTTVCRRLARAWPPLHKAALAAGLALAVMAPSLHTLVQFDRLLMRADTRLLTRAWLDEHLAADDAIYQSGAYWGRVQLAPSAGAVALRHPGPREAARRSFLLADLGRRRASGHDDWSLEGATFKVNGTPTSEYPRFILVQESPLRAYSAVTDELRALLASRYTLMHPFAYNAWTERNQFDQQDAFYLPFAGFEGVSRPGPNFSLYALASP